MVVAIKVLFSIICAFLIIGGALYMFTTDTLQVHQKEVKVFRLLVGFLMIIVGLVFCVVYKEYSYLLKMIT
jgi:hypothetical protein